MKTLVETQVEYFARGFEEGLIARDRDNPYCPYCTEYKLTLQTEIIHCVSCGRMYDTLADMEEVYLD